MEKERIKGRGRKVCTKSKKGTIKKESTKGRGRKVRESKIEKNPCTNLNNPITRKKETREQKRKNRRGKNKRARKEETKAKNFCTNPKRST